MNMFSTAHGIKCTINFTIMRTTIMLKKNIGGNGMAVTSLIILQARKRQVITRISKKWGNTMGVINKNWLLLLGYIIIGANGTMSALQKGINIYPIIGAGVCGIVMTAVVLTVNLKKGRSKSSTLISMATAILLLLMYMVYIITQYILQPSEVVGKRIISRNTWGKHVAGDKQKSKGKKIIVKMYRRVN